MDFNTTESLQLSSNYPNMTDAYAETNNTVLQFIENATFAMTTESSSNISTNQTTVTVLERTMYYYIVGPVICGFGIFCNILNLCVLLQRVLSEAPYTYLTALAFADLSFLAISFGHLVMSKADSTFPKAVYDAYLFFAFGNICFNCGVWVTVVMTIERVMFVTNPLKFRPSRKSARIRLLIIFIFCSFINVPRFFSYEIVEYMGFFYPIGTLFRESALFYKISWFHAVVINFIPLIVLVTSNTVLVIALHKAGRERASLRMSCEESSRRDQIRLTRTLVAIVVSFFICTTPSAFVEDPIAYTLFGGEKTWREYLKSPANQTFIYISNLLLFLNSSLNFVLYCAFNKRFRKTMQSLFDKIRRRTTSKGRVYTTRSTTSDTAPVTRVSIAMTPDTP